MRLRLKEDPRDWRKFGVGSVIVFAGLTGWLGWRGTLAPSTTAGWLAGLAVVGLLAVLRPGWFRRPYRLGMRVSYRLGQIVAPLLLGAIFFLVVTPLGWLLRRMGKDLLRLRRDPAATTYWQPASASRDLTRMF